MKVDSIDDLVWSEAFEPVTPRYTPGWKVAAVPVAFVGLPALTAWIRGTCWEAAVIAGMALLAILLLLRIGVLTVALVMVAFVVLSAGLLVGWSRAEYHAFDVFGPPHHIRYCGRDYDQGTTVGLPALRRTALRNVGVAPSGSAILSTGCDTTGIFVQTGSGTYVGYGLQGGP